MLPSFATETNAFTLEIFTASEQSFGSHFAIVAVSAAHTVLIPHGSVFRYGQDWATAVFRRSPGQDVVNRIIDKPPSAPALWQKGVHIQAFVAEIEEGEDVIHLAVDQAAVAKRAFAENGWHSTEE